MVIAEYVYQASTAYLLHPHTTSTHYALITRSIASKRLPAYPRHVSCGDGKIMQAELIYENLRSYM
jgi:hypothetical protein